MRAAGAFGFFAALAACGLSVSGELVTPPAEGGAPEASLPPDPAPPGDVDAGDAGADCGDVSSDPSNCGACGRSCLGGACADGGCAPFTVASGLGDVCAVSLSATDVFFAENSSGLIRRVPLAGGAVTDVHDTGAAPDDVLFDGDRVFWGDQHGAGYRMLASTTSAISMPPIPGGARAVLRAGAGLYAIGNDSVHFDDRELATSLATPIAVTGGQSALAANNTHLYFAAGSIQRVAIGGTTATSVVAEPAAMIALDASYVYWTDGTDVGRAPLEVWTKEPLSTAEGDAVSIAVDASGIYWADRMKGTIRMLPISAAGAVQTLASAVPQKNTPAMPRLIALDAVSIVYASSMDGKIYRLAK